MTDKRELIAYHNGEHVPHSQAVSAVSEGDSQRDGAVYDAERTFNGQVFKLRHHLERLYSGLESVGLDPQMTLQDMEDATLAVLDANRVLLQPGDDFVLGQVLSPLAEDDSDGDRKVDVLIYCQFVDFPAFAQSYVKGVRVVTPVTYSVSPRSFTATHEEASQQTFPLQTDEEGNITECTRANFMFVQDGRIKLPGRERVLAGISMDTVLELAESLDIPVDEDDYTNLDGYQADEAFVTSTRFCLLPVATFNGLTLGAGAPGPVTSVVSEAWSKKVGIDFVEQALSYLHSEEEQEPSPRPMTQAMPVHDEKLGNKPRFDG